MQRINFVVPIKQFTSAKTRLTSVLSGADRARLATDLYFRNLRWLRHCYPQHNVLVVTPDIRAAKMARELGADFILEERCVGLNRAIAKATAWSEEHAFNTQVVFFPDIARPAKTDVDSLLAYATGERQIALAVASDTGTNALLATPPSLTPLLFGPHSSSRIVKAAKVRQVACHPLSLSSLALDVDRPEDLQRSQISLGAAVQSAFV